MKKASLISVILVCCTLFSSNLIAQQFPNSDFESWGGGTPTFWEEWGFSESNVVQIIGYKGAGAKIQAVEDPGGTNYNYGMMISEPFPPITTKYDWIRFYYRANIINWMTFNVAFLDGAGNRVSGLTKLIDDGWNTNNWTIKEYEFSFSDIPSNGWIKFGTYASSPEYESWFDIDEIMLIDAAVITEPQDGDKWIAGQTDTIRWDNGMPGLDIILQYSTNLGFTWEDIVELPADSGQYAWDIPEDLLSNEAAIRIVHEYNGGYQFHNDVDIKIKPYVITKLDGTGHYVAYDINTDRWGFGNYPNDMWPVWWWLQFNYQLATDPFTETTYSQTQGGGIFKNAAMRVFPDWESFVNAFSVGACYWSTTLGIYSPTALSRWNSALHIWNGSCFGIAASNALAFEYKAEFRNKYPNFPVFIDPKSITSNENVIPVITELFAHQYGNPTIRQRISNWGKTPNETLNDMKAMLLEDETKIRTLYFRNNGGGGAHSIVPYKIEQDPTDKQYYYIWVWDNSYPNNDNAIIVIDTTQNGNNGQWTPGYGWDGWGGYKTFILDGLASQYLNHAILPKAVDYKSPFILNTNELEINNTYYADITIEDDQGNITGYIDSTVYDDIPGSMPLIAATGSKTPPYGYYLTTDNYSMVMNDFTEDTIDAFFFTGNKTFTYERYATTSAQTDRLFFDGGVSVSNPDQQTKPVKLLTIVNDTTNAEEKLFVMRALDLAQNDSVKIELVDNNSLKLISYGTAKDYEIGLEYVSATQLQLFGNSSIQLLANTTHMFVPEWPNLYGNQLTILVDVGNDGTIDDTLHIENQITDVEDDHGSMLIPDEYRLEQNYPNPFNGSTVIKYSIPKEGLVTLKIYNAIGEEVTTLVNELKQTGNYTATFDATNLTSGIYFYRLQAGDFIETKKMILLK